MSKRVVCLVSAVAAVCLSLVLSGCGDSGGSSSSDTLEVTRSSVNSTSSGGETTIGVRTGDATAWSMTTPASWVYLTSGESGVGPQSMTVTVSPNYLGFSRQATITVDASAAAATASLFDGFFVSVAHAATKATVTVEQAAGSGASSKSFNGVFSFSVPPGMSLVTSNATYAEYVVAEPGGTNSTLIVERVDYQDLIGEWQFMQALDERGQLKSLEQTYLDGVLTNMAVLSTKGGCNEGLISFNYGIYGYDFATQSCATNVQSMIPVTLFFN